MSTSDGTPVNVLKVFFELEQELYDAKTQIRCARTKEERDAYKATLKQWRLEKKASLHTYAHSTDLDNKRAATKQLIELFQEWKRTQKPANMQEEQKG